MLKEFTVDYSVQNFFGQFKKEKVSLQKIAFCEVLSYIY